MLGIRTAIVLGAGASCCYEDGCGPVPVQSDIIGRFFHRADIKGGGADGFPSWAEPYGLAHSFPLGQHLRQKFNIPEDPACEWAKLDFWKILQERGFTLETLYAELETDAQAHGRSLLDEFEAILRSAVTKPTLYRQPPTVCRYHRMLCESLEPGDYIINFNWDSVMADALLHFSHFWFPATGFGVLCRTRMNPTQKSYPVNSLVTLFHVHGSVVLFEQEDDPQAGPLFLGPMAWSALSAIVEIEKLIDAQWKEPHPPPPAGIERGYEDRITRGELWIGGKWFRPIFVPPSRYKPQYDHWYVQAMKKGIHSRLPRTQQLIIAGYSFPPGDLPHVAQFFVPGILDPGLQVMVVNPSIDDTEFRRRVHEALPSVTVTQFAMSDFREFCRSLDTESYRAAES